MKSKTEYIARLPNRTKRQITEKQKRCKVLVVTKRRKKKMSGLQTSVGNKVTSLTTCGLTQCISQYTLCSILSLSRSLSLSHSLRVDTSETL